MGYSIFEDTMADMQWTDIQTHIDNEAIVLLPTGVIEQQGPHISTGSDIYFSHIICKKIKKELEQNQIHSIIAPPFYWGVNHITGAFPGSFTSRRETVKHVLFDIFDCLHRWGFKHVFIVDIHGDPMNGMALYEAIHEGRNQLGLDVRSVISEWVAGDLSISRDDEHFLIFDVALEDSFPDGPSPIFLDIHAGKHTTANMYKYFPSLVDTDKAKTLIPTNLTYEDLKKWQEGGDVTREITPQGYFGEPAAYEQVDDEMDFVEGYAKFATLGLIKYLSQIR
ncbi:creatininase family protein [Paenibacillus pini]|uniref:Creatinine amidohydrolase n=1 Tax=Paenibacillus pini JCM 16418 TaxID=1236976 RepID=W7YWB5_9BACL|nr:creatininase family protein [Paenibacillus pini]GAF06609.1 creatinine amidohydrolase [Paenibacillus pini JCM 16418]